MHQEEDMQTDGPKKVYVPGNSVTSKDLAMVWNSTEEISKQISKEINNDSSKVEGLWGI